MGKEPTRSLPPGRASREFSGHTTLFAVPIFEQISLAPVGMLPPKRPSGLSHTGTGALRLVLVHRTTIRLVAWPAARTLGRTA